MVWTLTSYYRKDRREIADALLQLIADRNVVNPRKDELQAALALYRRLGLDFADALLAARVLAGDEHVLYSFDRDFDRVRGATRREPA